MLFLQYETVRVKKCHTRSEGLWCEQRRAERFSGGVPILGTGMPSSVIGVLRRTEESLSHPDELELRGLGNLGHGHSGGWTPSHSGGWGGEGLV